jgi:acyl transferase domain-containing protein
MGAALRARYPVFADALAECDAALAPHLRRSVTELVTAGPATDLDETQWTQPALFALEYALARLWRSWGITPGAVAGHSIGEVVAATVAGLFTLDDAARIVAARGRLMGSVRTAGRMVSIAAEAADVEPFLGGFGDLAIAAVNAPRQCVVSGGTASVTEVVGVLAARGIDSRPLAVSHAFHSPLMAAVAEEFRAALAGVTFHETTATFVSTVTGKVAKWREIADVDYWVRQLMAPVDFQAAVRTLHRRGKHVFVEIGPAGTLTALARRCVPAADHVWLTSLRRADGDTDRTVLDALAKGYVAGLRVDWSGFHSGRQARPVTLPTYAFARTRYWLPVGRPTTADEPAAPDWATPVAAPERAAFDPAALAAGDPTARRAAIAELVREELAAALSYPDPADLGLDVDFGELGVDSLVAVEVRKALSAALPVECPPAAVFEHPTARRLAHFLSDRISDKVAEHTGELEKIG